MSWLALLLPLAAAQEVQGFAEVRGSVVVGADGRAWQLVERFRPTFEAKLSPRVNLGVTVEAALSRGRNTSVVLQDAIEASPLGPLFELSGCTWHEHDNTLFRTDDAGDYLFVDRLYLDWYHPRFDLRIGRQALQWGSALFINPTDPFPEVLFTQPWRPRAGVNSARISIPVGALHQVQAVLGTDDDFSSVRAAARGTVNWKQTDWSLVAAWQQESDALLTGVDIKGTAGVGFWVEGALRISDLTEDPTVSEQLAVGIDYSFPVFDAFLVSAQYVRNGATTDGSALTSVASTADLTCPEGSPFGGGDDPDPFAPFLSGSDYGLLAASLVADDLSVSTAWLQNLGDGSGIVIPSVNYAAPHQIDVSLSAQIPVATWGRGEFKPAPRDLRVAVPGSSEKADFSGLVPDASVYLWTRLNY